jgi:hypothetical protein
MTRSGAGQPRLSGLDNLELGKDSVEHDMLLAVERDDNDLDPYRR